MIFPAFPMHIPILHHKVELLNITIGTFPSKCSAHFKNQQKTQEPLHLSDF